MAIPKPFCAYEIYTLYLDFHLSLSLSTFFISYASLQTNMESTGTALGKLKTKDELNDCEIFWHEKVFISAWQELHDKVS